MSAVLESLVTGPFQVNVYLLGDLDAGQAIVIDPGGGTDVLLRLLAEHRLDLQAIIATHGHIDHVAGAAELRQATGAPLIMHSQARDSLASLPAQALMFGLPPIEPPVVDRTVKGGDELRVGGLRLCVRETPGHAPGHVTLVAWAVPLVSGPLTIVFCGDVVFEGSIGRTDLPGGDYERLMTSIAEQILSLPDEAVLLPGHGPATTVAAERRSNPFVTDWLGRRSRPLVAS